MTDAKPDSNLADKAPPKPVVRTRARAYLRSLAHGLSPLVQLGNEGLSATVVHAVVVALRDHELIKVRIGKGFVGERKEIARELADAVGADLTQVIGHIVVLYRPRPAKAGDKRPRIQLPAGSE